MEGFKAGVKAEHELERKKHRESVTHSEQVIKKGMFVWHAWSSLLFTVCWTFKKGTLVWHGPVCYSQRAGRLKGYVYLAWSNPCYSQRIGH